jgi:hypothetical protein
VNYNEIQEMVDDAINELEAELRHKINLEIEDLKSYFLDEIEQLRQDVDL